MVHTACLLDSCGRLGKDGRRIVGDGGYEPLCIHFAFVHSHPLYKYTTRYWRSRKCRYTGTRFHKQVVLLTVGMIPRTGWSKVMWQEKRAQSNLKRISPFACYAGKVED